MSEQVTGASSWLQEGLSAWDLESEGSGQRASVFESVKWVHAFCGVELPMGIGGGASVYVGGLCPPGCGSHLQGGRAGLSPRGEEHLSVRAPVATLVLSICEMPSGLTDLSSLLLPRLHFPPFLEHHDLLF